MPVKIEIPSPLRDHTGGKTEVAATGTTVQIALADLVSQFPSIASKLFDGGKLRPYINLFVNDEDIRYLDDMDTAVADGQVIAIIPAVAGG
ncbi:MAG: MoaD/ThiS family protein [Gemmataceae bacterium]|nr:MoaD/ThiS family protein [Gemmataceae bacterium]